jgi:phenylpyruvate tautomerase PptA (4-oxalocrotonate tautomerase family)
MAAGTWSGDEELKLMVQVIVNAGAEWSDDEKQKIAAGVADVIKSVTADDGEVSVWFRAFPGEDVYVGADDTGREGQLG